MPPDETTLLARACDGNRVALADLFKQHDPTLRGVIQKRLPRRWQALLTVDDILQQTYVDAMLAISRFTPANERSFGAWLRKLAEHNVIEAIRALEAKKRGGRDHSVHSNTDSADRLFSSLTWAVTLGTPSQHVVRTDRERLLKQAIQRLPDLYQTVVRQFDLEGKPMDTIAAELGRSVGAAYLMRIRALERLRSLLNDHLTDFQSFS